MDKYLTSGREKPFSSFSLFFSLNGKYTIEIEIKSLGKDRKERNLDNKTW